MRASGILFAALFCIGPITASAKLNAAMRNSDLTALTREPE